jgi:hypothetical protein
MCGLGSKICPPDRATELLEAIIEPGDRVVIEIDLDPFHIRWDRPLRRKIKT